MHESTPDESLQPAIDALRVAIPVAPGLADRVIRSRQRHEIRVRFVRTAFVVALLLVTAITLRPFGRAGSAVTFALEAPRVKSVSLVGDFTDWRPDRVHLVQSRNGTWEVTVRLQPGRYRFAYVVNDQDWRPDGHAATVTDDFGRPTSILTVAQ